MSFFSKLFKKNNDDGDLLRDDDERDSLKKESDDRDSLKKGKSKKKAKPEVISIETPITTWYYTNDNQKEIGYEGDIDWYEIPKEPEKRFRYQPVGCYIDCDTPDTKEAIGCLERITKLFENRVEMDAKLKRMIADHYAEEDGMIHNGIDGTYTKEEFMQKLELGFISLYRDGRSVFSVDHSFILDIEGDEIHVVMKDGEETQFLTDAEFYSSI